MTKKLKLQAAVLGVLILSAGAVWRKSFFPTEAGASVASSVIGKFKAMSVESSQIHWERVAEAQRTEYEPLGRDIFSPTMPAPPPPPVRAPQPGDNDYTPPPPPPPPPPPKLPLKYFGYGAVEDGPGRRAFLTDGTAVYIVAEGDTVLAHYRILKITHSQLEFEEIGSGRRGTVVLEDQGPAF
jgi:hypothetical protein